MRLPKCLLSLALSLVLASPAAAAKHGGARHAAAAKHGGARHAAVAKHGGARHRRGVNETDVLPQFPLGVNSTFAAYKSLCPSRQYYTCFNRALTKRYTMQTIFSGSIHDNTTAAVRARTRVSCLGQQPQMHVASPSAGVGFVAAALLPPPPPPPGVKDPLADAAAVDAVYAAVGLGAWRPDPALLSQQLFGAAAATGAVGTRRGKRALGWLRRLRSQRGEPNATGKGGVAGRRLRCDSDSALLNDGLLLLIGVPSVASAKGRKRRDDARASWMQAPEVGSSVAVCFLLSAYDEPAVLAPMVEEAREFGDMLFLRVAEGRMVFREKTKYSNFTKLGRSMPTLKQFAFFDHAATHLPAVPYVGKVDDDTAINLREMLPLLSHVRCLRYSFTGAMNFAGAIPTADWSGVRSDRCGFGWSLFASLKNFGKEWGTPGGKDWIRACDQHGAVLPFPYSTGAGYFFSAALLQWMTKDPGVRAWVAAARGAERNAYQWQKYEDTTTGYWLTFANETVNYVNIERWVHDFDCPPKATGWLNRAPSPQSLLVHNLKLRGFHAAWELMQEGAVYDYARCTRDGGTPRGGG